MEVVIFIVIIISIIVAIIKSSNEKYYKEKLEKKDWDLQYLRSKIDQYQSREKIIKEYEERRKTLNDEIDEKRNKIENELRENCKKYIEDKAISLPWLAAGMADFMTLQEDLIIEELSSGNNQRNRERAIKINDLKKEKKNLIKENKLLRYQIEYFKQVIPEIEDIEDFDYIPVQYDENTDEVKQYLSDEEYNELSDCEKNQLALDRYWKRKKSKWEIGKDFERYYGYFLENLGYKVTYFGIEKHFEDLGRDLIAENDKYILIVQCKYWSKDKKIHEKHICQLYGSAIEYQIAHKPRKKVVPVFVTHTNISDKARMFAQALNVATKENVDLEQYPAIKCNTATGIYHLPMDQQYDRFEVKSERGDCYVLTTTEAENLGCRRARRWVKTG